MDQEELNELLGIFQIGTTELDALKKLREPIAENAGDLADRFYRHLMHFRKPMDLLQDPETLERLMASQREYLISLTDAEIDLDYVRRRAQIGTTHERIGLETRWYLGAYALHFENLAPLVREAVARDPDDFALTSTALAKRLMLDAEIAIRQYIERREQDLRHANSELEAAGIELSREMGETTADLRRTRARARAAEQLASVATLVTGLAHEIGTPMGVIRGHAEALGDAVTGERASWRLNMILEQIDRITKIIQSLLNIARPRESAVSSVDLPELVATSLGFLSEKLRHRAVRFETELEPTPHFDADPERMQQVLLNLFINAIDAMPEGGSLGVSVKLEGDSSIAIRVRDSGAGIPQDKLDSIFDPFYTTKEAGHGNGLGLVVVKGIVEDHGGEIAVTSREGEGTEFLVRLPVSNHKSPRDGRDAQ
jgi:signal transduction histidine kinase